MQYWIFYQGGVGGDGFANLLEHANNITPADNILTWRLRTPKVNTDKVAFDNAHWSSNKNFLRDHQNIDLSTITLNPDYVKLIENGVNTVISAHPWEYNIQNKEFKYWDILEKDQCKIVLYSTDKQRVYEDFYDKNGMFTPEHRELFIKGLDYHYRGTNFFNIFTKVIRIDIEKVWQDWDYLNRILVKIGIDLDRKFYEEYLDISKRRKSG